MQKTGNKSIFVNFDRALISRGEATFDSRADDLPWATQIMPGLPLNHDKQSVVGQARRMVRIRGMQV